MNRPINEIDLEVIKQKNINLYVKIIQLDKNRNQIADIEGNVIGGSFSFTDSSIVRRTMNLDISLTKMTKDFDEVVYFTNFLDLQFGIYHQRTNKIIYYKMGRYGFDSNSYSYDATNNTLSLSLIDEMGMLDASHRGVLYGVTSTTINALNPDGTRIQNSFNGDALVEVNGQKTMNTLKNALEAVFILGGIKHTNIEEIGAYSVVSQTTEAEREIAERNFYLENGYNYNEVPYNLEFSADAGISDMVKEIVSLYDGYEAYFDEDGVACANMIPTREGQKNTLESTDLEELVIRESGSKRIYDIKNVIEVWGKEQEPDGYSSDVEKISHSGDGTSTYDEYTINLSNYESKTDDGEYRYKDGFVVAGKFKHKNDSDVVNLRVVSTLKDGTIINYESYPVYNPYSGNTILGSDSIEENTTYLFQWNNSIEAWYYLGQYQVHGLAVLTDGSADIDEYAQKYNCNKNAIYLSVNPSSPFCVEKIGDVVGKRSGGSYDSITSDLLAKSNAKYELWKSSRRQDTINIDTVIIPFLDINDKIGYKRSNGKIEEFIVKNISGDLSSGIMSIELMKFYPLYENL